MYDAPLTGSVAVLLGNEAQGLPAEVQALADETVRVPIAGAAESLNLAAAAAVILFEAARQRTGVDPLADVVAGAAHDIRSPVTALRGMASTLRSHWDKLDDAQRLLMLGGLVHDAERMEIIVSQLVDAARLSTGSVRLEPVATDVLEAARTFGRDLSGWSAWELDVRGQPALKVHWLKPGKKKKPACGQVITSWSTSNPNVVTCQKCKVPKTFSELAMAEIKENGGRWVCECGEVYTLGDLPSGPK